MSADQQNLTQCGHPDCRTWRSKPCGEGCYWQPPDSYERVRAAAPDLLEALKVLVEAAMAAVKKAEGGAR